MRTRSTRVDFDAINRRALTVLPALLRKWLPNGQVRGREYVALNPRRDDRHLGSFRINFRSGAWADFAIGARGGDSISLLAYLTNTQQLEAAHLLARQIGWKR